MGNLYLILASLLFSACAAALLIAEPLLPKPSSGPRFEVKASENGGLLRLDWNTALPQVASAESASLEADDGGPRQSYNVERKVLDQGGLEYRRRTGEVLLILSLMRGGRVVDRASVRLTGNENLQAPR